MYSPRSSGTRWSSSSSASSASVQRRVSLRWTRPPFVAGSSVPTASFGKLFAMGSLMAWTEKGFMVAEQTRILREQVQIQRKLEADSPTPLDMKPAKTTAKYEMTKPGDPDAMRGVPLVGAAAGAKPETVPHIEGVRRADRSRIRG